ncbi:hypothetical protein IWQ60_007576 [Tieghemiomyces parasiticus]|uniref:5'-nucleotidase n=1 Tax=Tieghemiomyces parasiticus TaxID=78921 RepID=A0A9W8A2E3_9FUNG|nr:hypothetical protein IWQ60_007576 [Tieghemiomyces parasiticus]
MDRRLTGLLGHIRSAGRFHRPSGLQHPVSFGPASRATWVPDGPAVSARRALSSAIELSYLTQYYRAKFEQERSQVHRRPVQREDNLQAVSQLIDAHVRPDEVFANNEILLNRVSVYGFDYDYTLANYTAMLPVTIYTMLRDMLINKLGYPLGMRSLQYDPTFAIRGLHYDFETGWLFKLDAYHNIQVDGVHYGRETIRRPETVLDRHRGKHVAPDYIRNNLHHLNDLFSLPEACLLADVVQYFMDHHIPFHPRCLADDVRGMAQVLHGHGGVGPGPLHQRIMERIEDYLAPNPRIVHYLERLRGSGKKTFLLTNSSFEFVDKGLTVVTGMDRWIDLFDVVIVSAGKPGFYNSKRPFRRLETRFSRHGSAAAWSYVDELKPGEVYQGGNLALFSRFTGWSGHRVMYIGDHVFSDLRDPTLQQGWKTGAIIEELTREIEIQKTEEYRRIRLWMVRLEQLLGQAQSAIMRLDHDNDQYRGYQAMLESWRDERRQVRRESMVPFNRQFGSVFRAHQNPSYFAHKVISFADVYTSDLENLGNYPLDYVFYPERTYLPHERIE